MRRSLAAGAVLLVFFALLGTPAMAQEASPVRSPVKGVTVEPLFEVELGAEALPEELAGVEVFRKLYPRPLDPETEGVVYTPDFLPPNTYVRHLESGQLDLRPHGEVTVLRGGSEPGTIEMIAAEADVTVGPGDTIIQTDIPFESYGPEALGPMWHVGDEDTSAFGFAIVETSRCCAMEHQGARTVWQRGLGGAEFEAMIGRPVTVRLERVTLEPGATLEPTPKEPVTLRLVDAGRLTAMLLGPEDEYRALEFKAGRSLTNEELAHEIRSAFGIEDRVPALGNTGDEPLVLLQLIIEPTSEA
jgi:hypothetical protein